MKSFISPKSNSIINARVNKSGILTTTATKDSNETFNFKPMNETKDSLNGKEVSRKSIEL